MAHPSPIFVLDNGRYSILRRIGRGQFGKVYEGFDNDQGEQVAVKVLDPGVVVDEVVREATNQAKLRGHEHIVELLNVRTVPPRSFIVMELLTAGSVLERLKSGNCTLIEAVRWIRNGLDGLAFAHQQGILHRDFKPSNLMLGNSGTAKLSDFGVAEDTMKGQLVAKMYQPLWAPEFINGLGSSPQTDIWAVGCALYFLVTGQFPFGRSPVDTAAILAGRFQRANHLNPQIPQSLVRVIETALSVDLTKRYQSAWEMLAALLDCEIHRAWRRYPDPNTVDSWETCDGGPMLKATLAARPRGGFFVVIHRRGLNGKWRALRRGKNIRTEGKARQALASLLRQVVQTKSAQSRRNRLTPAT